MKKVFIAFTLFLFSTTVDALPYDSSDYLENSCAQNTIANGREQLKNLSYTLTYEPDITDKEDNLLEGYMSLRFSNLPEGYTAVLTQNGDYGKYEADHQNDTVLLSGDIYTISVYDNSCSSVIKSMNVKIPSYKKFCYENEDCDKNPWFDGTYENKTVIDKKEERIKVNKILIAILIVLILVTALCVFIIIKRRKNNEKAI